MRTSRDCCVRPSGAAGMEERGHCGRAPDFTGVPSIPESPCDRLDGARLRLSPGLLRTRRAVIIYIDTSALGRVYLGDQSDSTELSRVVYEGDWPVITSELTDVEIASTLTRASRDGVIDSVTANELLDGTQPTPPIPGRWASSPWTATPSRLRSGMSSVPPCARWMRSTLLPALDSARSPRRGAAIVPGQPAKRSRASARHRPCPGLTDRRRTARSAIGSTPGSACSADRGSEPGCSTALRPRIGRNDRELSDARDLR